MKNKLLPFVALALIIFSCKDVEEPSPNSQIEGKYVSTTEIERTGETLDLVNTIELNSDGTFYSENYTTEGGNDNILGYRSYYHGTYTIVDGKVTLRWQDNYGMNFFDIYYLPKADLILTEGSDFYSDYLIQENYTQLSFICPPNANCSPSIPYIKID
ncbi:hypothetical protein [uncultured Algoriphagus sp.]|uniref:hypothetical protein n=1 Tax=uncultured Algoriphagus sp. TaxID=417365 RepID=UPI0030EC9E63|tara:strand:- start:71730 stop:72203 length:474 start_codon:yes stop_codon:yes gene_type:complete